MYEKVITRLRVGEIIDPKLKGVMKNLIAARRANNDAALMEQFDVLSTLGHYLGYAMVMEWLNKSQRVVREVRNMEQAKQIIDFYIQLAEKFEQSEKTSKYATLDLQRKGKKIGRRLKRLKREIERVKNQERIKMERMQKKAASKVTLKQQPAFGR